MKKWLLGGVAVLGIMLAGNAAQAGVTWGFSYSNGYYGNSYYRPYHGGYYPSYRRSYGYYPSYRGGYYGGPRYGAGYGYGGHRGHCHRW